MTAPLIGPRRELWQAGLSQGELLLWGGIWHGFTRHYTSRGATAEGLARVIAGLAKPADEARGMQLRGKLYRLIDQCAAYLPESVARRAKDKHWSNEYSEVLTLVKPYLERSEEGTALLAALDEVAHQYQEVTGNLRRSVEVTVPLVQRLLDVAVSARRVLIAGSSSFAGAPHYILVRD